MALLALIILMDLFNRTPADYKEPPGAVQKGCSSYGYSDSPSVAAASDGFIKP